MALNDKLTFTKTLPEPDVHEYLERFKISEAEKNIFTVPSNDVAMRSNLAAHYTYDKVKSDEKNGCNITIDYINRIFEDKKSNVYGWTTAKVIKVYNTTFK